MCSLLISYNTNGLVMLKTMKIICKSPLVKTGHQPRVGHSRAILFWQDIKLNKSLSVVYDQPKLPHTLKKLPRIQSIWRGTERKTTSLTRGTIRTEIFSRTSDKTRSLKRYRSTLMSRGLNNWRREVKG